MSVIIVNGIEIEWIRKKIKNIHLTVRPAEGKVRVTAPERVSREAIRLFLISKIPWIQKQLEKCNNQIRQTKKEFVTGEVHYFLGAGYLLNLLQTSGKGKVELRNNMQMDLYTRPGSTIEQREKIMTEWYREQLKMRIPDLIEKWEKIMGVKVRSWGVKRMKTRWGTCNIRDRRIWINLELVKFPPKCLEYIVVHEMVHLLEKYHNKVFTTYMYRYLPDWRSIKEELNGKAYGNGFGPFN